MIARLITQAIARLISGPLVGLSCLAILCCPTWGQPTFAALSTAAVANLDHPARRIISLAPHITELLFAAGAGDRLVGAVEYSDYPPAARAIPRIGDIAGIDLERLLALRPDLVVAWRSGNPPELLQRIEQFGIPVYVTEPRAPEEIAEVLVALGTLAGTEQAARRAAADFSEGLSRLRAQYRDRRSIAVFFQISDRPLMTVNGEQMISAVLRLCGGRNVFADLSVLAPAVDTEGVLAANPEAILASGPQSEEWLNEWRRWPQLRAVRRGQLWSVPEDWVARPGPRILLGARRICEALDRARGGWARTGR